jgi:hypothetical protein
MSHSIATRLKGLGVRDWLALLVGPVLGWWLMAKVIGSQDLVPRHGWIVILGGLAVLGAVLGAFSPKLHGFAAVLVMVPSITLAVYGFVAAPENHNVIGGEIILCIMFTAFAVFSGWACSDILRFVRERRRVRPS